MYYQNMIQIYDITHYLMDHLLYHTTYIHNLLLPTSIESRVIKFNMTLLSSFGQPTTGELSY
jgi:hypothetical protein